MTITTQIKQKKSCSLERFVSFGSELKEEMFLFVCFLKDQCHVATKSDSFSPAAIKEKP